MQAENIIRLFVEDHERIASLLNDFKEHKQDGSKKTRGLFKQLKEALTRHFHQEELLYSQYKQKTGEVLPISQTIREEHEILLKKLDRVQQALQKGEHIVLSDFRTFLTRHKNVEERLLYPGLDNVLSDKEKEDAYWKIKVK